MTAWLLTWLWQGVALTASVTLLLRVKRFNASTRHLSWWAVLVANIWLGYSSSPFRWLEPIPVPVDVLVRGSDPNGMEFAPEPYLLVTDPSGFFVSIFLGVWVAIAAVKLVRLVPGLHIVYGLRDRCRPFPADVESRLPLWLEANEQGRRVQLMICDSLPGATMLGFQHPIIAIPSSMVRALTFEELDQIILHEHTHVQRRDDWGRLTQTLLQAVLWIHPAVAFVGRALNREREMACDERVVARTGLPKNYARCLTRAAEVRNRIKVEPLLVPALFGRRHDLVRRVNRLLAMKGRTRSRVSLVATATASCAIVVMSVQLNAIPLVGEYVAAALPEVLAPTFALSPRLAAEGKPNASAFARANSDELRRDRPSPRIEPIASAPNAPIAPNSSASASVRPNSDELRQDKPTESLQSRSFDGSYQQPVTEAATPSAEPTAWGAAANAGVELGNAARKTSVGIAGFFSRAGVSIARQF